MPKNRFLTKASLFAAALAGTVGAILALASPAYASGWSLANLTAGTPMANMTWSPIATSGSGKYVVTGDYYKGMYISSDYGAHFTDATSGTDVLAQPSLTSMTMSYTGQYVVAVSDYDNIYTSSDYGTHWTNVSAGTSLSALNWQHVVSSTSGQYVVASASTDGLFLSKDYGATWTNISSGTSVNGIGFDAATVSADGSYIAGVDGADVYGTQNGGKTWAKLTSDPSLDGQAFYSVAASSDGKNIFAAVYGGDLYRSSDYGATWTNQTTGTSASGLDWVALQASPTGQYIVASPDSAVSGGGVYASQDYGATWTDLSGSVSPSGQTWNTRTISASGQYVYADTDSGSIYRWDNPALQPPKPVVNANITTTVGAGSSVTVNVLSGASGYDASTLSIVAGPSHGTAVDPPGDITYTPNNGYTGPDSLTYQICAPLDNTVCSEGTLTFNVLNAPNTGFGQPGQKTPLYILGIISASAILLGAYTLAKRTHRV